MKKKGFTLIELLVVIAIIAMLMAILMPALGRVKRLAQRLVCGTNLKGLGTATLIYANENDDEFPIAGGRGNALWSEVTVNWGGETEDDPSITNRDEVTIAASQFLLVKYADVDPKVFICGSSDEDEFVLSEDEDLIDSGFDVELVELWDFGVEPYEHVSYSYHFQYDPDGAGGNAAYAINGMSAPGMAIMADKNPWYDTDFDSNNMVNSYAGDVVPANGSHTDYVALIADPDGEPTQGWDGLPKEDYECGNSGNHLREGQNVLYTDGHTVFEKRSDVGVDSDNIYTQRKRSSSSDWTATPAYVRVGNGVTYSDGHSEGRAKSDEDNWLVHDFLE